MDYPFEVGGKYRNHIDEYEVLEILDPKMVVRYADGQEASLTIAFQTRIWENIQIEEQSGLKPLKVAPDAKTKRSKKSTPSKKRWGIEFDGLVDHDFQRKVTGTTWRRRTGLAGLLARQLSDQSTYDFWSFATYRRPQIFLSLPHRREPNEWFPVAKLEFRLDEQQALYGFYIEKNDGPMDATWDWPRLLEALTKSRALTEEVETAMRQHELFWEYIITDQGKPIGDPVHLEADPSSGLIWSDGEGQAEKVSWADFIALLQAIPEDSWCDLRLAQIKKKDEAINLGRSLATTALKVYSAVLPVYLACLPSAPLPAAPGD